MPELFGGDVQAAFGVAVPARAEPAGPGGEIPGRGGHRPGGGHDQFNGRRAVLDGGAGTMR